MDRYAANTRSGQPCGILYTLLTIAATCVMFRCWKRTQRH